MIKIKNINPNDFVIKGIFEEDVKKNKDIIQNSNFITEFIKDKKAYIFLGKKEPKKGYCRDASIRAIKAIVNSKTRDFQVDVQTFLNKNVNESFFVTQFVLQEELINGDVYNAKTKKKKPKNISLVNLTSEGKQAYKEAVIYAEATTFARHLQMSPPNILNSVKMANDIKKEFIKHKNISVKVLNKKQITELKMGLFLSVNMGSAFEPRLVVLEYKGNPSSKEKTVFVGKGIMYDSGGMNIKTGRYMLGMKFDMSGAAIAAGAMKIISQMKPKQNFAAVLPLTDNMPGPSASLPDAVFTSMIGKTVEVNNTDAEGRLVMADSLTYGARKLKATRLIDIATLTGAILVALGNTYSGVWTTNDKAWEQVKKVSGEFHENTWRMPFHSDFISYMKKSPVADLRNTDYTGKGGSNSAAMFLKEFTDGVEYIHFDIAGTGDIDGVGKAPIIKTLTKLGK